MKTKLEKISVEPTEDGGFSIRAEYKVEREGKSENGNTAMASPSYDYNNKEYVATSLRELFEKLKKLLGGDVRAAGDFLDGMDTGSESTPADEGE
jgi:hypothetical protein